MQTKYELTLNYGAKWANAWFTGEIVSILRQEQRRKVHAQKTAPLQGEA